MKSNNKASEVSGLPTHEGGNAGKEPPEQQLRRIMACLMLFEDTFYESADDIAKNVSDLVSRVSMESICSIAKETRDRFKLRHAPLYLVCEALGKNRGRANDRNILGRTIAEVIQRADELAEILAIYWRNGRKPIPRQLKAGIAKAFPKFSAYQLAKYNRDAEIKLRDALFLSHAKPKDQEQAEVWKKLINGTLESPDTWEVQLSAGKDKRETFTRLIKEGKLGYLALLRNLRNMEESGVDSSIVHKALLEGAEGSKALPYRFVAAARFAPSYAATLSDAMLKAIANEEKLGGKTAILVDVSGSMTAPLSSKSQMDRIDAASALAVLLRAITPECRVFQFGTSCREVAAHNGLGLIEAIRDNHVGRGTEIGGSISYALNKFPSCERMFVITDMQSHDSVGRTVKRGYYINVAPYKPALPTLGGKWNIFSGFSERIIDFVREYERGNG